MGLSAQSTIIQNVDLGVSHRETVWFRSLISGAEGRGELRDRPR